MNPWLIELAIIGGGRLYVSPAALVAFHDTTAWDGDKYVEGVQAHILDVGARDFEGTAEELSAAVSAALEAQKQDYR